MLKTLIDGLFSTAEMSPQFIMEFMVLVAILEFVRMTIEFIKGVNR